MVKDTVFVSDSDVPAFKELKTVQIAALLAKRNGGAIDLYKLIKLMYLIDRRGLEAVLKTRTAFEKLSNQPPDASQNAPYHRYIHPICLIFYFCFRAYNNFKTAS